MGSLVRVDVVFFAGAKQAAGTGRASLELEEGTTLSQLAGLLGEHYGEDLAALLPSCALWVNGEPAEPSSTLQPDDEVAVLPPVSGGA